MWTYETERIVAAPPATVEGAVAAVIERIWGGRARLVASTITADRVDAIDGEGLGAGPDVWLSWHLQPDRGGTRLRLVLDEIDQGPDPAEGLLQILDLVDEYVSASSGAA